jgi:monofunctional biosynthetic peptidoglycan transglycosylase
MARSAVRRKAAKGGGLGRAVGWLLRAVFLFIVVSILWVLLYTVVPPPVTFTMLGDERRIRGGSTISQQTAKNAFLWQGGGYFRKGLEAWFTLLVETIWSKDRIMEVYLNVAETGIGTYGVNAGAQRYFGKDASNLSRNEAARIAAVLPLPKERQAVTPTGFTRRYGNSIAARIRVVARDGLDGCLRGQDALSPADEPVESTRTKAAAPKKAATPQPERAEDYLGAPDIGAPVRAEPTSAPEPGPPPAQEPPPAPSEPEPNGETRPG